MINVRPEFKLDFLGANQFGLAVEMVLQKNWFCSTPPKKQLQDCTGTSLVETILVVSSLHFTKLVRRVR